MTKIKDLDVQDIQQQVDITKDFISKTKENVEQVKQALNGVTTLHDGFAGNTADSIRSFYEEAHKPFLEFMESFLVQYEQALSTVSDQVLSFEPNESGFIRQEFLEGELTNKMQKAQDSLSATTDIINQQLNSVSDLASVSHVKDSVFLESIADAKKRITKTVDNMYEMDSNATSKLDKSEDDMQQMKTYMSKLRNAIDKNNISVENFNITQFNSEFFSYHNEFKLMAKGRNALATGESAEITAEEFNKLYPYIKNEKNVIDEYYEWDGTYHTLKDGRIIRHYMHDTGESYEFVDKIPKPRSKPLSDTEEFIYGAVGGVWDFFTEDLATVLNPEATNGEKAFALAMFLPVGKPVKIIDKGSGFVSDGIKSLDKIINNQKSIKRELKDGMVSDSKELNHKNKSAPDKTIIGSKEFESLKPPGITDPEFIKEANIPVTKSEVPWGPGSFGKIFNKGPVSKVIKGTDEVKDVSKGVDNKKKLSPSHYPNPDPPMTLPPVRYDAKTIEEVIRMRKGKGPTTKMTHGDKNIEAHHRQQVPVRKGGILDELEQKIHRGEGNHTRHNKPSELTPSQRAKEIREHYKERGNEYILPGEGI
ncbi:ribonuclease YeeF family protein [Terribacillus saccharophilus]|uniref:ribonuclease YeeF family protein n=1 Tax=Terribacillus saccharophilus TaxID=361277 RepID=UPI0013DDED73